MRVRVLLVEDHRMVAEAVAEHLEREADMEVVGFADSVDQAVEQVQRHEPDVVLMDYRLRDGDGVEATARIRDARPATQVVMVTSAAIDAVLMPALEAGAAGFVSKDRPIDEVLRAIRAVHAGEAVISPDMLTKLLPRLRPTAKVAPDELTPREREVLDLLADGRSTQEVANTLFLSTKTVRNHVQSVMTKLDAHSRLEAVAIATRKGIIRRTN